MRSWHSPTAGGEQAGYRSLERNIVVEVIEILRGGRRGLLLIELRGWRRGLLTTEILRSTATRIQHLHFPGNDIGRIAILAGLLILPLASTQ